MYPATEVQFADSKPRAISAWFDGHDFQSTGIAFEDYTRMQTRTHKSSGDRRLPTPEWAMNYSTLRSVIIRYYENRAGLFTEQPGTEWERLQRAQAQIQQQKPQKLAVLDRLCAEYVEVKRTGADPTRLQQLKAQIENLDTVIGLIDRGPGVFAAICYFYYHLRLDSPGVSDALGGIPKPVGIRQTLNRLAHVWEDIESGRNRRIYGRPKKYTDTEQQALSRNPAAAFNAARRAERQAAGLCRCGKRTPVPGRKQCQVCIVEGRKWYLRKKGGLDTSPSPVRVESVSSLAGPENPASVTP